MGFDLRQGASGISGEENGFRNVDFDADAAECGRESSFNTEPSVPINKSTRTDRWVGLLLSIAVGGVFGALFWSVGAHVFGFLFLVVVVTFGIYTLFASDESLEQISRAMQIFRS